MSCLAKIYWQHIWLDLIIVGIFVFICCSFVNVNVFHFAKKIFSNVFQFESVCLTFRHWAHFLLVNIPGLIACHTVLSQVRFITRIWHPNISSVTGAICLDILKDQWWVLRCLFHPLLCVLQERTVKTFHCVTQGRCYDPTDSPLVTTGSTCCCRARWSAGRGSSKSGMTVVFIQPFFYENSSLKRQKCIKKSLSMVKSCPLR